VVPDSQAERRHRVRREAQLSGDVVGVVADGSDETAPSASDSAAITAFWAASAVSMKATSVVSRYSVPSSGRPERAARRRARPRSATQTSKSGAWLMNSWL
jgi:hypothetical protein